MVSRKSCSILLALALLGGCGRFVNPPIAASPFPKSMEIIGVEAGWSARVEPNWMTYKGEFDAADAAGPGIRVAAARTDYRDSSVIIARIRQRVVKFTVTAAPCAAGESGPTYPWTVIRHLDGNVSAGCAGPAS